MKRVVITGMGAVSPIGNNVKDIWNNMVKGVCGIDTIKRFDASRIKCSLDAEVKDFNKRDYVDAPQDVRRNDLYVLYALAASMEAVDDSALFRSTVDKSRVGVYIGSGIGGIGTTIAEHEKLITKGPDRVSPFFVPMMIGNMASGVVAIRYGIKGPTLPIMTACATSAHAIGEAFLAIKAGNADAIIAGGAEAPINELAMAGFINCQALSLAEDKSCASIPFDKRRAGFVMAEGGAVLMLEEYEHAINRGANIYAEITGYGNTCDAYHMTAPNPSGEGAVAAIRAAVNQSEINGTEGIYVNAHGTGTHLNDAMETKALKEVFAENAYRLHISSTKSMTGHMLGATGAMEAIASVKAINTGIVPPTVNYKVKDEECDLDYTVNTAKRAAVTHAISTSLGFGGHNACLVFKKV